MSSQWLEDLCIVVFVVVILLSGLFSLVLSHPSLSLAHRVWQQGQRGRDADRFMVQPSFQTVTQRAPSIFLLQLRDREVHFLV